MLIWEIITGNKRGTQGGKYSIELLVVEDFEIWMKFTNSLMKLIVKYQSTTFALTRQLIVLMNLDIPGNTVSYQ